MVLTVRPKTGFGIKLTLRKLFGCQLYFKALKLKNGKKVNAYNVAWHRNKERSCYKYYDNRSKRSAVIKDRQGQNAERLTLS